MRPFTGAESGSPGRAVQAGKRGSPGRAVQAGIRGKRLNLGEMHLVMLKLRFQEHSRTLPTIQEHSKIILGTLIIAYIICQGMYSVRVSLVVIMSPVSGHILTHPVPLTLLPRLKGVHL